MPKYQSSNKYRSKQQYRSLRDIYRSLQNLYKRIDQLQRYKNSGSSSGSYGYRPRIMQSYSPERKPEKYPKEKVEPRYVVKTEPSSYRIEAPRFSNTEQLAEETEKRIESKLKPLIEGIGRKLDEREESASPEVEPAENPTETKPLDDYRTHGLELREFQDVDWDGSHEDLEILWNIKDALVRSVENDEIAAKPNVEVQAEPEPVIADAIRGTEVSNEFELASQPEPELDRMDFFALEDELFGMDLEPDLEDEIEGGQLG